MMKGMNKESKHGAAMQKPLAGKKINLSHLFPFAIFFLTTSISYATLVLAATITVTANAADTLNGASSSSAPAAPDIFYLVQPDGSKISVYARGDERFNWMETTNGYTIEKATDGFWYYVSDVNGAVGPVAENKRNGFVLTNVCAHLPPPQSLSKHIRPPALVNAPKKGGN